MQQFNNQILPITVTEVPGQFHLSVGVDHTNPKHYAVVAVHGYGSPIINVCHYHQGQWVPFYPLTHRGTMQRVANVQLGEDVKFFLGQLTEGGVHATLNASLVQCGDITRLVSTLGGGPTVVTVNAKLGSVIAYYRGYAVWLMHNGIVNDSVQMGSQEVTELTTLLNTTRGAPGQNYGQPQYGFGAPVGQGQPVQSNPQFGYGRAPSNAQYGYGTTYDRDQAFRRGAQQNAYNPGQPAGPFDEDEYRSYGPRTNAFSSPETLLRTVDVIRFKSGEFAAPSEKNDDAITGLHLEVHRTNDPTMHRITLPIGESQTIVGYIPLRDGVAEGVLTTGNYVLTHALCVLLTDGERHSTPSKLDYQQTSMGYDINVVSPDGVVSIRVKQKPALSLTDALYSVICNWDNVLSGDEPLTEEQYAIAAPAILTELSEMGCDNLVQVRTDDVEGIKYTVHLIDDIKQISAEVTDLSLPANEKFKAVVKLVCVDVDRTAFVDLKTVSALL